MSYEPSHRHKTSDNNWKPNDTKIIDMDASLNRLGQDRELQADLVLIFFEDSEILLDEVQAAWKSRQPVKLKQAAHCLKGLCSNFDAHAAVESAYAVEEINPEENWSHAAEAIDRLHCEISQLHDALWEWQAEQ